MRVTNIRRLAKKLASLEKKSREQHDVSVVVGYDAAYAIFVHEDLEAAHGSAYNQKYAEEIAAGKTKSGRKKRGWKGKTSRGPNQQAKFLEKPAREMAKELGSMIGSAMQRGMTMLNALLAAGLRLQRESQAIVPVDLGNLRGSAFTEKE